MDELFQRLANTSFQGILGGLIREKCAQQGFDIAPNMLDILVGRILSFKEGDPETINLEGPDISISFDDRDFERFEDECEDFLHTKFPSAVQQAVRASADRLLIDLKKRWPRERRQQSRDRKGFKKRLYGWWGDAFEMLDIYLTVSREICSDFVKEQCGESASSHSIRNDVLVRLHARLCQILDEIVTLLQNGFADGAMARWRTMHEICVVMTLIRQYGDDMAARYVDHDVVEAYNFLMDYLKTYNSLGFDAVPDQEISDVRRAYDAAITKYGKSFGRDYGWAIPFLPASNSFKDLASAAGSAHISTHYRMASQNIHAGIKGITNKLGAMGWGNLLLAGPSDAGLEEPGQCTAFTLALINMLLLEREKDGNLSVNNLLKMYMISDLQRDTMSRFVEAGKKLKGIHEPQPPGAA